MKLIKFFSIFAASVLFTLLFAISAFAQTGGLKGKVKNGNGNGIAGAEVTVRQNGKDLKSAKSDPKGNFTISGLKTGKYNVVFDAEGFAAGALFNVEVKDGDIRDLGNGLILYVDEGSQIIIRGNVFDANGFLLPGAKVEMLVRKGDGEFKKVTNSYSNSEGEFGFRHPQGINAVRITAKYKGVSASKDIDIDMAAIYRAAITLNYPEKK